MKTITFAIIFTLINSQINAQLKVLPNGNVGIGTSSPIGKLHISGQVFLTGNGNTFRILPNNPGTEIGSSTDVIDFWYSTNSHNMLRASSFDKVSDSTLKKDIKPLTNGLENLMQLKTYTYKILKGPENKEEYKSEFGFISQEIQKLHPDITSYSMGVLAMDYDQIIPIAVKAIQEQQLLIDSLEYLLTEVKSKINTLNQTTSNSLNNSNVLNQNAPNPFNERTTISFSLDEKNFRSATIAIFDMNGILIKQYPIKEAGNGSIDINANELKAGMYIYTLIVNQKEIDTKRMILLN